MIPNEINKRINEASITKLYSCLNFKIIFNINIIIYRTFINFIFFFSIMRKIPSINMVYIKPPHLQVLYSL